MLYHPTQPVLAVLEDHELPKAVRPFAQAWRVLDDAADDAVLNLAEAENAVREAPAHDTAAVEAAVRDGLPPVPHDAHQRQAGANLAAAKVRHRIAQDEKVKAGEALLAALLEHQAELAAITAKRATAAADAYEAALERAEADLQAAATALTAATAGMGTLHDLAAEPKYRHDIAAAGRPIPVPALNEARTTVALLRADVANLTEPTDRLIVMTTDGRFINFPRAEALRVVAEHGARIVAREDVPAGTKVVEIGVPQPW